MVRIHCETSCSVTPLMGSCEMNLKLGWTGQNHVVSAAFPRSTTSGCTNLNRRRQVRYDPDDRPFWRFRTSPSDSHLILYRPVGRRLWLIPEEGFNIQP